jgi:dihydroorotase
MNLKKTLATAILLLVVLPCYYNYAFAQEIDILLKGGQLIDPKNMIDAKMDVGITN